jgi:hypothetical protein
MQKIKILNQPEPSYPRVGEPIEMSKTDFRGHVIMSSDSGIYLEIEFDSESKALEYSAEYVRNVRENGNK